VTELCVIHPGALSPLCWPRLVRHLPAGTRLRVLELEAINCYWEQDFAATTVDGLADRLRLTLDPRQDRILVGWGFGGVVAESLAARLACPPRSVVLLDSIAPGADRPTEADLLRSYAMLVGARRGRPLVIEPERLEDGFEDALEHVREAASRSGVLRDGTTVDALRKGYHQHSRARLFDYRVTAPHTPAGVPLTVVKAARSILPESPMLGWDKTNDVELLASGGDHYTMLTAPDHTVQLPLLLSRWLTPSLVAV